MHMFPVRRIEIFALLLLFVVQQAVLSATYTTVLLLYCNL